mgnify:CR=1 FL=1
MFRCSRTTDIRNSLSFKSFTFRLTLYYIDIKQLIKISGVKIYHSTIKRWVFNYAPLIKKSMYRSKNRLGSSWRINKTYIKVSDKDKYLYRALDKYEDPLDFLLIKRRTKGFAQKFFKKAISKNEIPWIINIVKSGSNFTGIRAVNRNIKRWIAIDFAVNEFESEQRILVGIEIVSIIRMNQIIYSKKLHLKTFLSLVA